MPVFRKLPIAVAVLMLVALIRPGQWLLASAGGVAFTTYTAATPGLFAGAGDGTEAVGVGDFNHDGIPDLAASNHNDGTLSILIGQTAGGYVAATSIQYRAFLDVFSQGSVSVADLNRDGWDDVVVASNGSTGVFVILGTGPATFAAPTLVGVGTSVLFATIADLNRDGIPDVVAAENNTSRLSVLLGNGNGTFAAPTRVATGAGPFAVAVADFDGDGKLDLASANISVNTVSVFSGNGAGAFSLQATVAGPGPSLQVTSVAAGDVNGDGFADLVTTSQATVAGTSAVVATFLSNGAGGFTAAGTVVIPAAPKQVLIADMNRDGALDLILTCRGTSQVQVLLGTGSGTFSVPPAIDVKAPTVVRAIGLVAIADLNRDGMLDVAVSVFDADGVSILMASPVAAPTTLSFATSTVPVGLSPTAIDVADVNRDGRLDFVTSNYAGASVSVVNGTGGGAFGAAQTYATQASPFSVIVGDFDRNGRPDVLTNNNGGTADVSVLLNDGSGALGNAQSYAVGKNNLQTSLGDFNRDGILDVVTADNNGPNVSIVLGNASGGFGAPTLVTVGAGPFAITTGDFNGDGKLDIATANSSAATVTVLLGNGSGGFSAHGAGTDFAVGLPAVAPAGAKGGQRSIAAADFNRDGKLDLVTTDALDGTVSVLFGNGAGAFAQPALTISVGATALPEYVRAGDMNGDGAPDLVVANNVAGTVSVVLGNGDGTFRAPQDIAAGTRPLGLALADIDRDGQLDILVTNATGTTATVLRNTSIAPNRAPVASLSLPLSVSPGANCVTTLPLTAVVSDADGDAMLYRWTENGALLSSAAAPSVVLSLGSHTIALSVDDQHGHVTTASGTVVVKDTTAPTFLPPVVPALEATSASGAFFDPSTTATDNCDSAPTVTIAPSFPGNIFPVGDTTLIYTASDHASPVNATTVSVVVTVLPAAAPVISSHADETVEATSASGATVTYVRPSAIDNLDGIVAVNCAPASGTAFPMGSTVVSCAASDHLGHSASSHFNVQVRDTAAPTVTPATSGLPAGQFGAPRFFEMADRGRAHINWSIATADLNGDGFLDVVTSEEHNIFTDGYGEFGFSVALGNGAGGFRPRVWYEISASGRVGHVVIGDFNRDGRPDIAVAGNTIEETPTSSTFESYIAVSLNLGGGVFAAPTRSSTGDPMEFYAPNELASGDFNADGNLDLAAGSLVGNIVVMLGDGHGAFSRSAMFISDGQYDSSVAVGDFNGDGRDDVASVEYFGWGKVLTWLSNGDGTFAPPTSTAVNSDTGWHGPGGHLAPGHAGRLVRVGDVNGDHHPDLVTISFDSSGECWVTTLLGDGAAGFAAPIYRLLDITFHQDMVLADLNHDGKLDLAVSNAYDASVAIATGDGSGGFSSLSLVAAGQEALGIASGAMNGDGLVDLVLGGRYRPDATLLLNGLTTTQVVGASSAPLTSQVPLTMSGGMTPDGSEPMSIAVTFVGSTVSFAMPTAYDLVSGVLPVTCDTPSGSELPIGTTHVTCTAVDAAGNTGTASFDVIYRETCAPGSYRAATGDAACTLASPGSYVATAEATAATLCAPGSYQPSAGAAACLLAPAGTFVDVAGAVSATPCPAGVTSGVGSTVCTVPPPPSSTPGHMRGDGFIAATGSSMDKPRFTFDILEAASGADRGRFSVWTAHDSDQDRDARRRPHRHDLFEATSITSVVFIDDPAVTPGRRRTPSIDTVVFRGTGELNDVPGYTFEVTAIDAGEPGKGVDSFTLTVSDATGHMVMNVSGKLTGGNIQSLRLPNRTPPPMFTGAPWPVVSAEASSSNGAIATYALPTAVDGAGAPLAVSCAPASGTQFDLGSTQVSCTASDAGGRTASMHFRVVVADHVAPVFARVPQNLTVQATSTKGVDLTILPPTATDLVDGAVAVKCSPSPDRRFDVGVTTVTCKARDDSGNEASVSFTVTVKKK